MPLRPRNPSDDEEDYEDIFQVVGNESSSFRDRFRTGADDLSCTMEEDDSGGSFGSASEEEEESERSGSYFSQQEDEEEKESDATEEEEEGKEQEEDFFADEYQEDGADSDAPSKGSTEFEITGMETLEELEQHRQAATANHQERSPLSPLFQRAREPSRGTDVLRGYMDVLHGSRDDGTDSGSSPQKKGSSEGLGISGQGRTGLGLNSTLHHSVSDDDNTSVSNQIPRLSRREAVKKSLRIDFLKDSPEDMTYTRRIALHLMNKYNWYNPRLGKKPEDLSSEESSLYFGGAYRSPDGYPMLRTRPENPSLENAWAYFEHFTLQRYVYEPKPLEEKSRWTKIRRKFQKSGKLLERAERNENILPTKLYDPIWTPHNQLGDWGIGWGLYFASLRGLMILSFLAGLISIPNMMYFSSTKYSSGPALTSWWVDASAICTSETWVPCPGCQYEPLNNERLGYVYFDGYGVNLTYSLRNNCNGATQEAGFLNFGVLIFILFGLFLLNHYLMKMEVIFDEDEQTAQDYTILVKNPPSNATDPEEWRNFFLNNLGATHVVAVTVAVDNDELVKKIVERRECMKRLELLLEPGTVLEMNNLAGIAARVERERGALESFQSLLSAGIPELFQRIVVLTIGIRGLAQHDYPATKVFVTFETETDQRRVLQEMAVGSLYIRNNDTSVIKDRKYLFRGEHMLYIQEPSEEPNTYRWISMNERFLDQVWQQILTSIATFAAILLVAFIVRMARNVGTVFAAYAISIFNGVFPEFAKILTKFEGHSTEAGVQTSMYVKICLFRWVNTAIVITIITPFTATLVEKGGLISQVYTLFFTEIFTLNVIQLVDPVGHFYRHFLAPHAKTQDEMNIWMKGLEVELAERYTNMTKIFFLSLWYSSIYPAGFLMGAFALFVNYFTDRFSLMRTWKRSPPLGPGISEFSRRYFVTASFLAMAVLSSYFWSAFPFDNLCENEQTLQPPFELSQWNLTRYFSNETFTVNVAKGNNTYRFCNQDMFRSFRTQGLSFPFLPSKQPEGNEWMTDEQEHVSRIYGWAAVGAIIFASLVFIQGWLDRMYRGLWGETLVRMFLMSPLCAFRLPLTCLVGFHG